MPIRIERQNRKRENAQQCDTILVLIKIVNFIGVLYGKYCGVWVFIRTHIIIVMSNNKRSNYVLR